MSRALESSRLLSVLSSPTLPAAVFRGKPVEFSYRKHPANFTLQAELRLTYTFSPLNRNYGY